MSEQFSTSEQGLIERLRRAPQPSLGVEARSAIHARLMDAIDHPPAPALRLPAPQPVVIVIAVLVMAALIGAGVLLVLSRQTEPSSMSSPTATLSATPSLTITTTAQATKTSTPSPTPLPTITVIEGQVESITGNVIIIFDIEVTIAANDPILTTLQVGDTVRVEGNSESGTGIVATRVQVVNADVTANPNTGTSSGEVWQDDGSCLHPPPDWAPANGWRRRCEGREHDKDNDEQDDDD